MSCVGAEVSPEAMSLRDASVACQSHAASVGRSYLGSSYSFSRVSNRKLTGAKWRGRLSEASVRAPRVRRSRTSRGRCWFKLLNGRHQDVIVKVDIFTGRLDA